jgi:hypothetical protein
MAHTHAIGIGVRHAISRALATANLAPADATYRVVDARVKLDTRDRVVRGETSLQILQPRPLSEWTAQALVGVVNPDGCHPLMVTIHGSRPFFMDVFPVTWNRWLRQHDDRLPVELDPLCPRTGATLERVRSFALQLGKRLPTQGEFQAAWGPAPLPWGERNDARLGRVGEPRFGALPEVGLHPPCSAGLFDLGAWLWHWTEEGMIAGGAPSFDGHIAVPAKPDLSPIGIRLVQDP